VDGYGWIHTGIAGTSRSTEKKQEVHAEGVGRSGGRWEEGRTRGRSKQPFACSRSSSIRMCVYARISLLFALRDPTGDGEKFEKFDQSRRRHRRLCSMNFSPRVVQLFPNKHGIRYPRPRASFDPLSISISLSLSLSLW
jgi:hypothetical protein